MEKKNKTYLNDIGRFTSFTFIGQMAKYLFLIISSALVTNFFGKEVYGQYSFIISFLTILMTVSSMGLGSGVVYFGQKYRQTDNLEKAKGVIGFAYLAVGAFSITSTILVMVFSEQIAGGLLNSTDYAPLLRAMAPLIAIESLFGLSMTIFRSLKRIARFSLIQNIYYHIIRISTILVVFLVFDIRTAGGIAISTYVAYVTLLAYSIFSQHRNREIGKQSKLSGSDKKEILLYSLPLFMSSIIGILLRQADILMIGYIKSDEAVAVYKVAVQICAIIPFIKHMTGNFFAPMISSMFHSGRKKEMVHIYSTITKWEFTFGLMVFLGIVLFGRNVLSIFGKGFMYGYTALILVATGSMAKVITGQSGSMISMTGHTRINLVNSIITFTVNIVLNIIMIPRHGIIGAAVATMISTLLGNFMSLGYLYATQKIQPFDRTYLKPIVSGAVSYAVIALLNGILLWEGITDVLVKGSLYVIIFVGMLFLMKLNEDDRMILNSMLSSVVNIFRRKTRK